MIEYRIVRRGEILYVEKFGKIEENTLVRAAMYGWKQFYECTTNDLETEVLALRNSLSPQQQGVLVEMCANGNRVYTPNATQ